MFSFLGSIFGKIASAVVSVFVSVGLISAPASVAPQTIQLIEEPVIIETTTSTTEVAEEIDIKAELEKLKNQLAEEQSKRKDLEKKVAKPQTASVVAPVITPPPVPTPAPVVAVPVPTPAPTPTPAPSTPITQLLPGQFMLPSGAIVDSTGKVVKPAPISATTPSTSSGSSGQATTTPTPPPPPAPTWPPADGSTVDIQRSVLSVINFNSQLTCDQLLALPPSKKDLCKLYKNNEGNGKYTWRIVEDL